MHLFVRFITIQTTKPTFTIANATTMCYHLLPAATARYDTLLRVHPPCDYEHMHVIGYQVMLPPVPRHAVEAVVLHISAVI